MAPAAAAADEPVVAAAPPRALLVAASLLMAVVRNAAAANREGGSSGPGPGPHRTAAPGLTLELFEIEHPEPGEITPILAALGAGVTVRAVAATTPTALVAVVRGPGGAAELR